MTATHYQGSRGPMEIATMPLPYLENALAKLEREQPERTGEIEAMRLRLVEDPPEEAPKPREAVIGDNGPPEATAYEAHAAHIDDLYTEAKNWADGADIETEAQAAEVDRLIDDFKAAIAAAEASRDAEKKPYQAKVTEIQERYYPLLADTTKLKGKAITAKAALLAVKTVWGRKVAAKQAAEAEALRAEAARQAQEAAEAARSAVGNIEATESAEDLIRAAQQTLKAATVAEKPAVKGMRDNWVVVGFTTTEDADGLPVDGRGLLLRHYLKTRPDDLVAACMELARQEVRDGKRTIPGVVIENQRRAV